MRPNYNRIYQDLLQKQHPEKLECPKIREQLSRLDSTEEILKLNEKLFKQCKETSKTNQQLKTYDKKTMIKLLNYQKKHDFSTSFMSKKYNISRTTFSKWKKLLEEELQSYS